MATYFRIKCSAEDIEPTIKQLSALRVAFHSELLEYDNGVRQYRLWIWTDRESYKTLLTLHFGDRLIAFSTLQGALMHGLSQRIMVHLLERAD